MSSVPETHVRLTIDTAEQADLRETSNQQARVIQDLSQKLDTALERLAAAETKIGALENEKKNEYVLVRMVDKTEYYEHDWRKNKDCGFQVPIKTTGEDIRHVMNEYFPLYDCWEAICGVEIPVDRVPPYRNGDIILVHADPEKVTVRIVDFDDRAYGDEGFEVRINKNGSDVEDVIERHFPDFSCCFRQDGEYVSNVEFFQNGDVVLVDNL